MRIGQNRIGKALGIVAPNYHQDKNFNCQIDNRIPYKADYFGHKLQIDLKEKLVIYGVVHVVAIDGHSRFIAAGTTMTVKNNVKVCKNIYWKQKFSAFLKLDSHLPKKLFLFASMKALHQK